MWDRETPEIIAEYARAFHDPRTPGAEASVSNAFYAQLAYRLPGAARAFKPYTRFEGVDVRQDNVILADRGAEYNAAILGLRYDFAPVAALKAEYRRERFATSENFHSVFLQVSFTLAGSADEGHADMLDVSGPDGARSGRVSRLNRGW